MATLFVSSVATSFVGSGILSSYLIVVAWSTPVADEALIACESVAVVELCDVHGRVVHRWRTGKLSGGLKRPPAVCLPAVSGDRRVVGGDHRTGMGYPFLHSSDGGAPRLGALSTYRPMLWIPIGCRPSRQEEE